LEVDLDRLFNLDGIVRALEHQFFVAENALSVLSTPVSIQPTATALAAYKSIEIRSDLDVETLAIKADLIICFTLSSMKYPRISVVLNTYLLSAARTNNTSARGLDEIEC
jgi:hypothetical protein